MVEGEDKSFIKSTVGPTRTADALVKTLGIFWNTATEEISFDFTELIESAKKNASHQEITASVNSQIV